MIMQGLSLKAKHNSHHLFSLCEQVQQLSPKCIASSDFKKHSLVVKELTQTKKQKYSLKLEGGAISIAWW